MLSQVPPKCFYMWHDPAAIIFNDLWAWWQSLPKLSHIGVQKNCHSSKIGLRTSDLNIRESVLQKVLWGFVIRTAVNPFLKIQSGLLFSKTCEHRIFEKSDYILKNTFLRDINILNKAECALLPSLAKEESAISLLNLGESMILACF